MESHYMLFLEGGQSLGILGICTVTGQVQRHLGVLCPLGWELGLGERRERKMTQLLSSSLREITWGINCPTWSTSWWENGHHLPGSRKLTLPEYTTSSQQS